METKILKLNTQEEIICRHEIRENGDHFIKNPCILILTAEGYGAMPWMQCAQTEKGMIIRDSSIVAVADPVVEIRNEYEDKFGSGLVVPNGPIGLA